MATKVKGEAIKEGSIPMSALSTEVKDKIENAGAGGGGATPDWNALKGEAGYIENKPYKKINSVIEEDDPYTLVFKSAEDEANIMSLDYNTINHYIKINNISQKLYHEDYEITSGKTTYHIIYNTGNYYLSSTSYNADDLLHMIESGELSIFFIIDGIDAIYLPDDVIKTTPQTLSNTDKNQALSNLGIDPVVWKYMMNPCIIKQGEKVPEELIGKYSDDVGYNGGYYLKYPNLAMYKIMITDIIDIEFGDPASVIITPSDISEYGLDIRNIYISKDYGVYTGGASIDEDKNWEIQ